MWYSWVQKAGFFSAALHWVPCSVSSRMNLVSTVKKDHFCFKPASCSLKQVGVWNGNSWCASYRIMWITVRSSETEWHVTWQWNKHLSTISTVNFCGEGNGNPLQYSCLESPRYGGAWWAAVYGVAQGRTRLKRLSSSSSRWVAYNSTQFLHYLWVDTRFHKLRDQSYKTEDCTATSDPSHNLDYLHF